MDIEDFNMNYIVNKLLEQDQETGLDKELRFVNLAISAEDKTITITYIVVLISPTGVIMKELERGTFKRFNDVEKSKPRYDQLEQSPIGQGIKQMLQMDLAVYPDLNQ